MFEVLAVLVRCCCRAVRIDGGRGGRSRRRGCPRPRACFFASASHSYLPLPPLAAFAIKERIYGNRIVLFAPLYIANYCVNNCRYCAFRQGNKTLEVWAGSGG